MTPVISIACANARKAESSRAGSIMAKSVDDGCGRNADRNQEIVESSDERVR